MHKIPLTVTQTYEVQANTTLEARMILAQVLMTATATAASDTITPSLPVIVEADLVGSDEELAKILGEMFLPTEAEDTYGALYHTSTSVEETEIPAQLLEWRAAAVRTAAEARAVSAA